MVLSQQDPADARLRSVVEAMASGLVEKSTDGKRVKMGASPEQLAAVGQVWH